MERVNVGPLSVGLAAFTLWRNAEAADFTARISMESEPERWPANALSGLDLACAIPHWDWEFRHFPRAGTRALARRLAGAGFGLLAGHHAHVLQPVERIGDTLVAYGLGDFLGTAFARQPWPGRIGGILVADVSTDSGTRGRIASYRLHPFMRLRVGDHERLVAVDGLAAAPRRRIEDRLAAIFPERA